MIPVDLKGKVALVTGVADNVGFGWHIATKLQEAGADVILASHPRVVGIVERFLSGKKYAESRQLGNGEEFAPKALLACDVEFDTAEDVPDDVKDKKGYVGKDVSIAGCLEEVKKLTPHLDIVIHSVGFSPEITIGHDKVSRAAYLKTLSISSYSLVSLSRACRPLMEGRNGSIVGLSFFAANKVYPEYGGGMGTAKAALESDARNLAWFFGKEGHRVNIVSPGPYGSRAAKSIGDIDKMVRISSHRSPIERGITADEVANATLFMCSDYSKGITGQCLYVDNGYNIMGAVEDPPYPAAES